jgi:hypothetical protein
MATGKIRADINFVYPYPRTEIHTRARARARNPPRARGHARVPANFRKSSTRYISTASKHHLFNGINKSEQINKLVS